jgi:hypothetical protein
MYQKNIMSFLFTFPTTVCNVPQFHCMNTAYIITWIRYGKAIPVQAVEALRVAGG